MKPSELPLNLTRGDDARLHIQFNTAAGAFDLTDYLLVAEVRERADPTLAPVATFDVVRGGVGEVTIGLEEEDTLALPPRSYWSFRTYLAISDYWQTWLAGDVRTDYQSADVSLANEYTVLVGPDDVEVVLAANVGPPGMPGQDGDAGQQGTTGLSAYDIAIANGFVGTEAEWLSSLGSTTYVHDQSSASSVWTISHGLGIYPSVTTVTSGGDEVYGNVHYTDSSSVTVTFSAALGGKAYLS